MEISDASWEELRDAAAQCSRATALRYDEVLRDGCGVAFYRVQRADPEHRPSTSSSPTTPETC
ncbi:hypothetical protein Mth01_42440 [Sphaerimonospora thailandensis]|uniref:Uncharacterized protein n=1 Tax=Sphaerimonospora thailandensis TaxID=795644 RepID=A0A8J3RCW2_9ACTN|nr:hypothetical protein Mth01_42440 [Sphaerimonospora thailandensis]